MICDELSYRLRPRLLDNKYKSERSALNVARAAGLSALLALFKTYRQAPFVVNKKWSVVFVDGA